MIELCDGGSGQLCHNTPGGYECICPSGAQWVEETCIASTQLL